MFQICYYE